MTAVREPLDMATRNLLLRAASGTDRDVLLDGARVLSLDRGQVLWEPGQPIRRVYFPLSGVVSLVTALSDGDMVEMATVGREGIVGLQVFLGSPIMSNVRAFNQIPGKAVAVDADAFRERTAIPGPLREMFERYSLACLVRAAQEVACNRLHALEERCARWLLTTQDQVERDAFGLTQEFLAEMLGVRRASVTAAAGALQRAGLIRYRRGWIEIHDRTGLEKASCECYETIRAEFDEFLRGPHGQPSA